MQLLALAPTNLIRWRGPAAITVAAALALAAGYFSAARSPLLAGGAVVGTLLGAWALRRRDVALYGLVGVIALMPFGVLPFRAAIAPTFLDAATAGVFLVWLARAAHRRSRTQLSVVGACLLAFVGAIVAAYVLSGEALRPNETARLFVKVAAAHLLFVPVLNLVPGRKTAGRMVAWLMFAATVEALVAVALYVVPRGAALRALNALGAIGYPTGDAVLRYRPETDILRATGTSVDPNMLGALLMVAAALAAPQLLAARPVLPKPLIVASLIPLTAGLLLSESRGSWLGLVAGLFAIGALRYRRLVVILVLLGGLALALPQAQRFTGHLTAGLRAEDRASAMRIGELQNAIQIIQRHPWFGAGWGAEGDSIELAFTLGVSNVYLTVAERSGVVALAAYLATLTVLAAVTWRGLRRSTAQEDDGLMPGLAAALVGTQVAGLVDHHFVRFPHLISLLWIVAALAIVVARDDAMRPAVGRRLR